MSFNIWTYHMSHCEHQQSLTVVWAISLQYVGIGVMLKCICVGSLGHVLALCECWLHAMLHLHMTWSKRKSSTRLAKNGGKFFAIYPQAGELSDHHQNGRRFLDKNYKPYYITALLPKKRKHDYIKNSRRPSS